MVTSPGSGVVGVKCAFIRSLRLALYVAPRGAGEQDGAAVALAASATDAQLDDLIGFLSLKERGQSRAGGSSAGVGGQVAEFGHGDEGVEDFE